MSVTIKSVGIIIQDNPTFVVVLKNGDVDNAFTTPVENIQNETLKSVCEQLLDLDEEIKGEIGV